jgi:hypothetical protein
MSISNGTSKPDPIKVTAETCKLQLEYFIDDEKPGLRRFFPSTNNTNLDVPALRAAQMVETLVNDRECAVELAFKFMVLTLYDLAILLGRSLV